MSNTSPTHLALIVAAVTWPLAAGLAIVLWSKARAAARARKLAAVEHGLRSMYRAVESRGAPAHLQMVVEALEEGEALAAAPRRRVKPKATTPL